MNPPFKQTGLEQASWAEYQTLNSTNASRPFQKYVQLGRVEWQVGCWIISWRSKAYELDGVKIVRYEESIYYANVDNFKYRIVKAVEIDPKEISSQLAKLEKKAKGNKVRRVLDNLSAE